MRFSNSYTAHAVNAARSDHVVGRRRTWTPLLLTTLYRLGERGGGGGERSTPADTAFDSGESGSGLLHGVFYVDCHKLYMD